MIGVVDLSFSIAGGPLPVDYAWALYRSVLRQLGWLDDEPIAGIHPLRGVSAMTDRVMLGGRSRLVLRVPPTRVEDSRALCGARLGPEVEIAVGEFDLKPLKAHPVLYSPLVSTGSADEAAFQEDVRRFAADAGLDCRLIAGKRRETSAGDRRLTGYSLMLHGLSGSDSLRVQAGGLGEGRKLGCGVFVPHKTIAPVGTGADWQE